MCQDTSANVVVPNALTFGGLVISRGFLHLDFYKQHRQHRRAEPDGQRQLSALDGRGHCHQRGGVESGHDLH